MQSLAERQRSFAAALLDPALPAPAGLVGPDGKPSSRRFAVYRNNVIVGLTQTLKDAYPAVHRIVGSEFFHALARAFVVGALPRSPMLFDYGAGLPGFIGRFEPASVLPYLADVARIERARTEAYHSAEASLIGPSSFAEIDPDLPVNIVSMQQRVSRLTARQRFLAVLLGLFAGFGLLLAAVGLYGVLSFLVTQRTREIGVRMAMGATPGNIAALVERQAGLWVACGVVAGLTASLALGRVVSSVLFKVSPDDGWSLSASVAMLALVASLAAWVPARRAAMIDPAASLRAE